MTGRQKRSSSVRRASMTLLVTVAMVILLWLPMSDGSDNASTTSGPHLWNKIFETACEIACGLGFLIMLGAAGGCDNNTLSFERYIWLSLFGLGLFIGGGYLGGIIQ